MAPTSVTAVGTDDDEGSHSSLTQRIERGSRRVRSGGGDVRHEREKEASRAGAAGMETSAE